jgi:hypothetical protein
MAKINDATTWRFIPGIPPAGATNFVLDKVTATDYDVAWAQLPDLQSGVGVNVNTATANVVKFDIAEEIAPQTVRLDSGVKLMAARLATTAALTATYNNGVGGVGATLTASANGALTLDTVAVAVGNVVLVRNQANAFENGVYTVTATGDGSNPFVLTRSIYAQADVQFAVGIVVVVTEGDKWLGSVWRSYPMTVTPGTTSIVWRPFTANADTGPTDSTFGVTRLHRRYHDDYEALSSTAVTAAGALPSLSAPSYLWIVGGSTGAGVTQNGAADITSGSAKLDTGTTATGALSVTFTNLGQQFDGTIPYAFGARFKVGTVTVAATQSFHVRAGIMQALDTGVITNGAFFWLPDDASTIKAVVMDGGTPTTVDTTVAQGTGQHVYGINYDEVTKQFEFTYDSSFRTLINAPAAFTTWTGVMAGCSIIKTVGTTSRDVRVDYMTCRMKETRPNWLYLPA